VRVNYKIIRLPPSPPAFPAPVLDWLPLIPVRILYDQVSTKPFLATVDSGSRSCLFHASIGESLGIRVRDGVHETIRGVVASTTGDVYYHKIKLAIAGELLSVTAGFSYELPVPALLGRDGFLNNFRVTFDPDADPPGLELHSARKRTGLN
jgi:hypothetical protein